jgi:thiamine biosynthesis lipoprotein
VTTTLASPRPVQRSLRVEQCMGTVFTIDIRDAGDWTTEIEAVVAWLHFVDATFSTYRRDSDVCRIRRGELRVEDADPHVTEVLDLCAQAQRVTRGYFTALPDGRLDPTGLVKGWSIERASLLLRRFGSENHAVNGGGDMQLAGEPAPGEPWRVGIADPRDASRLIDVVSGRDFAVATSGVAERGAHIVDPFTGRPAVGLASATVVGPELTTADAYATAACAIGASAVDWIERLPAHHGLLVSTHGTRHVTSGWQGAKQ